MLAHTIQLRFAAGLANSDCSAGAVDEMLLPNPTKQGNKLTFFCIPYRVSFSMIIQLNFH